jgi:hypothetical protein
MPNTCDYLYKPHSQPDIALAKYIMRLYLHLHIGHFILLYLMCVFLKSGMCNMRVQRRVSENSVMLTDVVEGT